MSTSTSNRPSRRLAGAAALGLSAALALAACSSSGGSASTEAGGSAAGSAAAGTSTLKVTSLGLCAELPVFWAQDKGLFADHGLTVELEKVQGGAAGLAAVQSGAVDVAFANPFTTMKAIDSGIDLKYFANLQMSPVSETQPTNALFVKEDSPIQGFTDFDGKKIAVNELGGINNIVTAAAIKAEGGDPSKVEWVNLPFPDMGAAVAGGKVDAGQGPAQFMNATPGLRDLGNPFVIAGAGQPLLVAGYVAPGEAVAANEAAYQGFKDALAEAVTQVNDPANADEALKVQSAGCKQDVELLKKTPQSPYGVPVDPAAMERMRALLTEFGGIANPPAVNDFVPAWSQS